MRKMSCIPTCQELKSDIGWVVFRMLGGQELKSDIGWVVFRMFLAGVTNSVPGRNIATSETNPAK